MWAYDVGRDVLGASGSSPTAAPVPVRVVGSRWTSAAVFVGALASLATLYSVVWRKP